MSRRVTAKKLQFLEYFTLKAFFARFKDQIQKVKCDVTGSKRNVDKFEKLVNHQQLFFLFYWIFTYWERKQLLLFPIVDLWIKIAQGSRSANLNGYILSILLNQKPSSFSTFWTTRKLLIVTYKLKKSSLLLCISQHSHIQKLEKSHSLHLSAYTLLRDLVWVYQTQTSKLFIVTWPISGLWELGKARKILLCISLERLRENTT